MEDSNQASISSAEATWKKGVGDSPGFKLWSGWLQPDEASTCFVTFNDDDAFPWDPNFKLHGEVLNQHAYSYMPSQKNVKSTKEGLKLLEQLRSRIASDFQCEVHAVFCNRFTDPKHSIEWHRDKYGAHIFVLTLGESRGVEYRHDKTNAITRYDPSAGDLYFMSLQHNKQYTHRVLPAAEGTENDTRISLVFITSAPLNMKEYTVSISDQVFGMFNVISSGLGWGTRNKV